MCLFRVVLALFSAFIFNGVHAKTRATKPAVLGQVALNKPYFEKQPGGVILPEGFLKGVAYSTYQNGGHRYWPSLGYKPESNWSWFEGEHKKRFFIDRKTRKRFPLQSVSPIDRGEKVGISAVSWDHLFDDIKLMKDLGVNSLRFELPWTDLNPEQGVWNEEAFALFDTYIDALKANGIEPMITLYHWVHPLWFHKLGGWEKEHNIGYYVRYVQKAVNRFGDRVKYWNTINEPTVISACGYILGSHAPGEQAIFVPGLSYLLRKAVPGYSSASGCYLGFRRAACVLFNLFKAHNDAYAAIKSAPNGKNSKVGIVHQMSRFSGLKGVPNPAIGEMNDMFAHDLFMKFFRKGEFDYPIIVGRDVKLFDKRAPLSLDFIGLNFYASVTLAPAPTAEKGETMTDMVWAIRPHSMYEGIKEVSKLGVPIMITENGIPDAKDDRRAQWIIGYSNALKKAIDEGYDVRGYYYWSLFDNYEWNMGHDKKFGLYEVDTLSDDPTKKTRTLREGAKPFRDYLKLPRNQEDPQSSIM